MKAREYRGQTALIAEANADYEISKEDGCPHRNTISMVEKRWNLKPGQIANFRANLLKRKTPVPEMQWLEMP